MPKLPRIKIKKPKKQKRKKTLLFVTQKQPCKGMAFEPRNKDGKKEGWLDVVPNGLWWTPFGAHSGVWVSWEEFDEWMRSDG